MDGQKEIKNTISNFYQVNSHLICYTSLLHLISTRIYFILQSLCKLLQVYK